LFKNILFDYYYESSYNKKNQIKLNTGNMKSPTELPRKFTKQIVDKLNANLATFYLIFFQIKKHHWLVEGPYRKYIHVPLDEYAKPISTQADLIAERMVEF